MDLSIIVPVYNVEKYIRSCFESIFKQGLDDTDFEVIIVNDGTKDRSMEMIADIIAEHKNITVINKENQGLSEARNNGLEKAKGTYIMFVDSDDLLVDKSVPFLLKNAISAKVDLVVADLIQMDDLQISALDVEPINQNNGEIIKVTGKDLLMTTRHPGYYCVWHTLYKRDFLKKNNIRFIPYIYFEDTPFTLQCYLKANHCLKANWLLNIYRIRNQSISNSEYNKRKAWSQCVLIEQAWKLSLNKDISYEIRTTLQNDAYAIFTGLFSMLSKYINLNKHERLEIIYQLQSMVPSLSFNNGINQRITTSLYQKMPSLYLSFWRLRNNFIKK